MTLEEVASFFGRFGFHFERNSTSLTEHSMYFRDRHGEHVSFRFQIDATPEEVAALAREWIEYHGFDLP